MVQEVRKRSSAFNVIRVLFTFIYSNHVLYLLDSFKIGSDLLGRMFLMGQFLCGATFHGHCAHTGLDGKVGADFVQRLGPG